MKTKKETYLMKLAVLLFGLAAVSVITFGILSVLKMPFKFAVLPVIAAFMFFVWAIILVMIDKKADSANKNNVMAKPEDVQQEILDKLDDIATLKKEEQKVLYCAHCGTKINEGEKTCSQCGSNLQTKR
jgi:hypothetical protein